jgi:hypothetical protein
LGDQLEDAEVIAVSSVLRVEFDPVPVDEETLANDPVDAHMSQIQTAYSDELRLHLEPTRSRPIRAAARLERWPSHRRGRYPRGEHMFASRVLSISPFDLDVLGSVSPSRPLGSVR